MQSKSILFKVLKGELRTVIAVGLLFVVLIGLGIAADLSGSVYKFDFGDGQGKAFGYIPVNGNISLYPQISNDIQFGWLGSVIEKSSGAMVSDLRFRDSNTGVDSARFKISGLTNSLYNVELISGDLNDNFLTRVLVEDQSYTVSTTPGDWKTITFNVAVDDSGELEFLFERPGEGRNLWGINALILTPVTAPLEVATFDMEITPLEHVVKKGGTVVYKISVVSLHGYASFVNLSLDGIVGDITGQLIPASGLPPFTSDLRITTNASTPSTHYDFIINAQGDDVEALSMNQNIKLVVTDLQYVPAQPDMELSESIKQQIEDIYSMPSTPKKAAEAQKLIDEFIKQIQDKKLANHLELKGIEDIKSINFVVFKELPSPETTFEASLLYLAQAGIMGSVVDTAPPAEDMVSPPSPPSFFERLLGTFTNPVR